MIKSDLIIRTLWWNTRLQLRPAILMVYFSYGTLSALFKMLSDRHRRKYYDRDIKMREMGPRKKKVCFSI